MGICRHLKPNGLEPFWWVFVPARKTLSVTGSARLVGICRRLQTFCLVWLSPPGGYFPLSGRLSPLIGSAQLMGIYRRLQAICLLWLSPPGGFLALPGTPSPLAGSAQLVGIYRRPLNF